MAFKLIPGELPGTGIKRILHEETSNALSCLFYLGNDPDKKIHDARKSIKKIRAVLRLIRFEIENSEYEKENILFRDAGRKLSGARNSLVLLNTFDSLNLKSSNNVLEKLKIKLKENYESESPFVQKNVNILSEIAEKIHAARTRFENLILEPEEPNVLQKGLKRIYKAGYKQTNKILEDTNDDDLHELRKRAKYLWYALRLFQESEYKLISELIESLHRLSDFLGEDHDLSELTKFVLWYGKENNTEHDLKNLLMIIENRRKKLRSAEAQLAAELFKEKPSIFINKLNLTI